MRTCIFLIILLLTTTLLADEPPLFDNTYLFSKNNEYKAEIFSLDDEPDYSSEWRYRILKQNGEIIREGKYKHEGYYSLLLSDDGKYLVYINQWFEKEGLIYIYSKEGIKILTNKEIKTLFFQRFKTVSHYIWLDDYYINDNNMLILDFIFGFSKKVNLETGEVTYK